MKTPLPMRFILATLFLMLALTGCCTRKTIGSRSQVLLGAQTDALTAKIVLTELRDGRFTNALELLESQIDSSIIVIDGSLSKLPEQERETAFGVLQSLKAYRVAHPRQCEAVIADGDNQAMTQQEMTQKASRILSELK